MHVQQASADVFVIVLLCEGGETARTQQHPALKYPMGTPSWSVPALYRNRSAREAAPDMATAFVIAVIHWAGKHERDRDASACMRRHQAFALAPVQVGMNVWQRNSRENTDVEEYDHECELRVCTVSVCVMSSIVERESVLMLATSRCHTPHHRTVYHRAGIKYEFCAIRSTNVYVRYIILLIP